MGNEGIRIGFLAVEIAPVGAGKLSANFLGLFADLLLLGRQGEIHDRPL